MRFPKQPIPPIKFRGKRIERPCLVERAFLYNALLLTHHREPVATVILLLREKARAAPITGTWSRELPWESEPYLSFRYRVIEVWRIAPEQFLEGGISLLPFAPLGAVTREQMPALLQRMREKLRQPAYAARADDVWAAVKVLMGLRYEPGEFDMRLDNIGGIEESWVYQALIEKGIEQGIEKGRCEGERAVLQRLGTRRFGPPPAAVSARLQAIADPGELERLAERLFDARDWNDLLAE